MTDKLLKQKIQALEKALAEERERCRALESELENANEGLMSSMMSQQRFTDHLEDLVRQRTQEASKARDEALAASRAKSDFLATMSHEIRTPMNAIVGFTQLLLQSELTEKQRQQVTNIDVSGRNLLQIINDILDFSKIEAGKLELETVDFSLHELFDQLETIYTPQAGDKGLALAFVIDHKIPHGLHGDSLRINQILINLISNALKFTNEGSITVMARLVDESESGCEVEFSCQDTGLGILPDYQANLFSAFTQADSSTTREYGGTGLGLSICRKLVDLMGGDIWVKSKMGHGSTFYFRVPLGMASELDAAIGPCQTRGEENRFDLLNVLLVEDNEINQELALEVLRGLGVEADLAQNGLEALEKAKMKDYDVVFMDIQMPLMDGMQTTQRLRENFPQKDLFVVAMTANASSQDRQNCLNAGMNDFISKPISVASLANVLEDRYAQLGSQPAASGKNQSEPDHAEVVDVPVVDEALALERIGGRDELFNKMLSMFKAKHSNAYDEILELIEAEQWSKAQTLAHTLKGVLANIAAQDALASVTQLDAHLKTALDTQTEPDSAELMQELNRFKAKMQRLLAFISEKNL